MLFASSAAMAQDCCKKGPKLKSYSFVEVQGGMEWTATDAKIDKLLSPIGAVSIGHYFSPVVGARLHVSGLKAKGRFENLDKDYKWNFLTTDADLLVNLTNLFSCCNYSHPLNVIFVGGIGLTNAWKNDDMKDIVRQSPNLAPLAWTSDNRLSHNLRAGLRLETNVTKPLGLSLEVAANSLDDRFNSKIEPSETHGRTVPLFVVAVVDDGSYAAYEFPVFIGQEIFGFAELKGGILILAESFHLITIQVGGIIFVALVQVVMQFDKGL